LTTVTYDEERYRSLVGRARTLNLSAVDLGEKRRELIDQRTRAEIEVKNLRESRWNRSNDSDPATIQAQSRLDAIVAELARVSAQADLQSKESKHAGQLAARCSDYLRERGVDLSDDRRSARIGG
jgi:hypothetical protein